MAVYRFSASVIGRSSGRSAVAAAAYRAGEDLTNERDGVRHNYSRRHGVAHTEILAPDGSPDWVSERAELWNRVEATERRKDAQLAREILMSLPHELDERERVELARSFARDEFVSRGMVADVAVHRPDRQGDDRNHHAHIMLTLRPLEAEGFGKKAREWNDRGLLEGWRERWAEAQNRALERAGLDARVDHRSLEDRGIERDPEPKLGPQATAMERQGRSTFAGDDLRTVWKRNAELARARDSAALAELESDLAREDFSDLFAKQRDEIDQERGRRQSALDALNAQLDGRSRIAVFWDKLRGRVGWNAELDRQAEIDALAVLEERQGALERAQEAEQLKAQRAATEAREAEQAAQQGRDDDARQQAAQERTEAFDAAARQAEIDQMFQAPPEPEPVRPEPAPPVQPPSNPAEVRQAEVDQLFNEPSQPQQDMGRDLDRDR